MTSNANAGDHGENSNKDRKSKKEQQTKPSGGITNEVLFKVLIKIAHKRLDYEIWECER